jgi:tetratricopeptide (TPR) repeat protein
MKSTLSLATLALLLILGSCKKDAHPLMEEIQAMEKTVEANSTADNIQALIGLYEKYIAEHPADAENNARFLHKAAYIQYNTSRYASAVKHLKQALLDYFESSTTPDNALFLASIYREKMDNPKVGEAAYRAFLLAFPEHEKAALVRDSILSEPGDLAAEIDSLRMRIYNERTNRYDNQVSNEFIGACEMYGLLLPKAPRSPDLLYDAARTAGYIRSFPKAVELYDWVYRRYPDFQRNSQALFMMAFTYDNEMKNLEKAKELYLEFVQKFPDDDFADDVQVLLQNLGKSEEEILKALQQGG